MAILGTQPNPVSVNPAWGGGRASLEKRNASKSFTKSIWVFGSLRWLSRKRYLLPAKLNDLSLIPGTDTVDVEN